MKSLAAIDGTWAMKKFPERLKNARMYRQYQQSDLAGITGLLPSAISHFECGRRRPSMLNLIRIRLALRVNLDYLLGINEAML